MKKSVKQNSAPKVTPWFPGDVKPARPGVYQRNYADLKSVNQCDAINGVVFASWNGRRWGVYAPTPAGAALWSETATAHQDNCRWRGLASNPEGAA